MGCSVHGCRGGEASANRGSRWLHGPTRLPTLPTLPTLPLRSFMDGCTGRAGLAQLSDTFVSDPHLFFLEGQSVRATVVQVRGQ